MPHGAFGAMGGVQTSAVDYAKWVGYLLSACWRATVRTKAGQARHRARAGARLKLPGSRMRLGHTGTESCRQAVNYGMGMIVSPDCELGLTLSHGGGYPGYGSHVLLPDYGVGVFAFTNRSYRIVGAGVGCGGGPEPRRLLRRAPPLSARNWRRRIAPPAPSTSKAMSASPTNSWR
jgi:hypothetical protein